MSKKTLSHIAEGLIATIIVIILYIIGIISGWGLVAFLFVGLLVFVGGRYANRSRQ